MLRVLALLLFTVLVVQAQGPPREVDEAMREGEAAFAKGEFSKALELYQRALALDPKLYEAALYIGDVYYKTADQPKACEWFARAVAINPDRAAAYRYWGDSLIKQGKVTEAGDKFVESFIAEPYTQVARAALISYGERLNLQLAHPRVDMPADVTKKSDKETTITFDTNVLKKDDKSGASAAWLMYSLARVNFASSEFAKEFPDEKTYRHSLKEETTAIRAALKALAEKKSATGDASLQVLSKLDKEGLLESYILLAMPDAGIAKDYPPYRQTNVDKLRTYVKQYVLTGGGK